MTVVLQSKVVRDAGGHGHGTHTGIANQGVQLLVLGQEQVHQLNETNTAGRGDGKGKGADDEDEDGVQREELAGLRRAAHGET